MLGGFIEYQSVVDMSGHLIQEKAASLIKMLYPTVKNEDAPAFSIGCRNLKLAGASARTFALAKADLSTLKHWRRVCRKFALNWTSTTPLIFTTWMRPACSTDCRPIHPFDTPAGGSEAEQ